MTMELYNTLGRRLEEFTPQNPPHVSVYTCGPTVYGEQHIGNYRTFIFEDVLVKTLRHFNFQVKRVMNITDVGHLTSDEDEGEDKLEVGARREGITAWQVAQKYELAFLKDLAKLNIEQPEYLIKATETIPQQIELIQRLEVKGFTYQIADGVYFDSSKVENYGELAQLDIKGLQPGARVEMLAGKRLPTDFALWKLSPSGQKRDMEWESPWGTGFPGWHLECSAIAMSFLGEQIDIHCGGVDHIPVHHTNEISQSEAVTGKQFARFWLHGEFLLIDGGKMSKSLGNLYTLADLEKEGIEPSAFRYFCYGASYRSKLNVTWEGLHSAQTSLSRLREQIASLDLGVEEGDFSTFDEYLAKDLHMPKVLAEIWDMLKSAIPDQQKRWMIQKLDTILSLDLEKGQVELSVPAEVQVLLRERTMARESKDWQKADHLRGQIEGLGFSVKDTEGGQVLTILKK
jgi:cysteinyl-tRNA synthetase